MTRDVLVHIGHPGHVHLFREPVRVWREQGRRVLIALRRKDQTVELAEHYGLNGTIASTASSGWRGLLELLTQDLALARMTAGRKLFLVGTSIAAAQVGRLLGRPSIIMIDDDIDYLGRLPVLTYPFCTAVFCPEGVRMGRYESKTVRYPSYHKLFYLHPNRFRPDPSVRTELGLAPEEPFAVVRLSALKAHHDKNIGGLGRDLLRRVLEMTAGRIRVFVSSEEPLAAEFEPFRFPIAPERMHDCLALAEFFLGDSQTMAVEAAVLGTPAFRINDFVGRITVLQELEDMKLAYGFKPDQSRELPAALESVLETPNRRALFEERRRRLLARRGDPLDWFIRACDRIADGEGLEAARREEFDPGGEKAEEE